MSTDTFKCTVIHNDSEKRAIRVEHNGIEAWIPRSQIVKMSVVGDKADVSIPHWLYLAKFETKS